MSHSGDWKQQWPPVNQRRAGTSLPPKELSLEALADHLHDALADKPDAVGRSLGSPISPLRTQTHPGSGAATSSSGAPPRTRRPGNNNSGELSAGSSGSSGGGGGSSSPTAESFRTSGSVRTGNILGAAPPPMTAEQPPEAAGVRKAVGPAATGLLIQAGNSVNCGSPVVSGKSAAVGGRSLGRSDVLGLGTGSYGHGSVMRGSGRPIDSPVAGESVLVRRAVESGDPEEVKKAGNEQYKKGHFAEALLLYDRAIEISPGNAACRSNRAAALTALGRLTEAVRECEEAVRLDPNYVRAHQRLASLYLR